MTRSKVLRALAVLATAESALVLAAVAPAGAQDFGASPGCGGGCPGGNFIGTLIGWIGQYSLWASFAAALIFGVLPAWKASRPDVMDVLRSSGRIMGGGGRWLRDGAVVAEVALAFVLLVGSGLMIRTFIALQNANPGFDPSNVLTFLIQNNRAQGQDGRQAFQRTMVERLKAILSDTIRDGDEALVRDAEFLAVFGMGSERPCTARELWRHLIENRVLNRPDSAEWESALRHIVQHGTLSRRIRGAVGNQPSPPSIAQVYDTLSRCLAENECFPTGQAHACHS